MGGAIIALPIFIALNRLKTALFGIFVLPLWYKQIINNTMSKEIERKFLVKDDSWKGNVIMKLDLVQQYLAVGDNYEMRCRIIGNHTAFLTTKLKTDKDTERLEFENEIDLATAQRLIDECKKQYKTIIKTRNLVKDSKGRTWEVDEYFGDNDGLVVAEYESEDAEQLTDLPNFIGKEVTKDSKYKNKRLAVLPYQDWD